MKSAALHPIDVVPVLRHVALESGNKRSERCAGNVEMHFSVRRNFIPTTKALSLLCDLEDNSLTFFKGAVDFCARVHAEIRKEQMALSTEGIFTPRGRGGRGADFNNDELFR